MPIPHCQVRRFKQFPSGRIASWSPSLIGEGEDGVGTTSHQRAESNVISVVKPRLRAPQLVYGLCFGSLNAEGNATHGAPFPWVLEPVGPRGASGEAQAARSASSLASVIVEPSLPGFQTGGNGVTCFPKMLRGVLTGRAVTTSDESTLGASEQVEPPPARSNALLATLAARLRSRINSARLRFHAFLLPRSHPDRQSAQLT